MNTVLVLCAIIALSVAVPISEDGQATVLRYDNDNDGTGNYEFSFETSNGIFRTESGRLVNVGEPEEHLLVQGFYSYINENGEKVVVRYTADENGYRVEEGQPLGVPPSTPLPAAAVASLLG